MDLKRAGATCLAAAALVVLTAIPALADGDNRGAESAPPTPLVVDPHGDFSAPGHRVKLDLPRALTGEQSAEAPKFSLEFGYGAPPLTSTPPLTNGLLGGRTELRGVKAGVSFDF